MLSLIQRIVSAFEERRDAGHARVCAGDADTDGNRESFGADDWMTSLYMVQQSFCGYQSRRFVRLGQQQSEFLASNPC